MLETTITAGLSAFILATWIRTEQRLTKIETKLSYIEKVIAVRVNNGSKGKEEARS